MNNRHKNSGDPTASTVDACNFELPTVHVANPSAEKYAILIGLAVFWLLLTMPTVLFSQWFPLDMPVLFNMGEHLQERLPWILSPHNGSGRYFPLYWLYHAAQYLLFGSSVWPYFVVLSVIYLAGTVLIARTIWRMTGSLRIAALLFVSMYINTPTPENLTTIGKGEPLAFFLIACVVAVFRSGVERGSLSKRSMILITLCFLAAIWIKETSLVLVGFAASGAGFCWVLGWIDRRFHKLTPARPYFHLLTALCLGWLVSKLPYIVTPKTSNLALYTEYAITEKLIKDNFQFYVTQQPDVFFFGLLALALIGLAVRSHLIRRDEMGAEGVPAMLVFALSLCAMGWAYWLAMLFWRWPMAYYMLLPSIVFKLCAFYGLYLVVRSEAARPLQLGLVKITMTVVVTSSALAVYYIGASQIAFSRIYTDALIQYEKASSGMVPLVIESYPFYAEQVGGTGEFLKNQLSFTSRVAGIGDLLDPAVLKPEILDILQVTPEQIEANIDNMPRKGQYLLVFTGNKLATWFLRGVTPYFSQDAQMKLENIYDMELVAEKTIETPAIYLHEWTRKIDISPTYVGYKLYRVLSDKPRFFWRGRYPDGWVGFKSSLKIDNSYNGPISIKISVPQFTVPNRVRVFRDEILIKELDFNDPNEVIIDIGPRPVSSTQLAFEVERAVAPKEIRMNKDERKLGARIALVPMNNAVALAP